MTVPVQGAKMKLRVLVVVFFAVASVACNRRPTHEEMVEFGNEIPKHLKEGSFGHFKDDKAAINAFYFIQLDLIPDIIITTKILELCKRTPDFLRNKDNNCQGKDYIIEYCRNITRTFTGIHDYSLH